MLAGATAAQRTFAATQSSFATLAITFTRAQSKTAWKDLHSQTVSIKPSPKSATKVGAKTVDTVPTMQMSSKAAHAVPKLKFYRYAMPKGKLLTVNPRRKRIVDVVSGWGALYQSPKSFWRVAAGCRDRIADCRRRPAQRMGGDGDRERHDGAPRGLSV